MSLILQELKHGRRTNPAVSVGVVIKRKLDNKNIVCYDVLDDDGAIFINCYPLNQSSADAGAPYVEGDEVVVLKRGMDGINTIVGGTTKLTINNFITYLEGDDIPERTPISREDYDGVSPGDYNAALDADTRYNLNTNIGATVEGLNINLQVRGGILRISNNGDSTEYLLNGLQFIDYLTENLHTPLVDSTKLVLDAEENLRAKYSIVVNAIVQACQAEILAVGPASTLATSIITSLQALSGSASIAQFLANNGGSLPGVRTALDTIVGTSEDFSLNATDSVNRSIKVPNNPDQTQRGLTDF